MLGCEVTEERAEADKAGHAEHGTLEAKLRDAVGVEVGVDPRLLEGRVEECQVEVRVVGDRECGPLIEPCDEGEGARVAARPPCRGRGAALSIEPPGGGEKANVVRVETGFRARALEVGDAELSRRRGRDLVKR